MPFILPDLVIESVLREGFHNLRESLGGENDQIEDIFSDLKSPYLNSLYGEKELKKIKDFIVKPIFITHSFNLNPTQLPCVAINLNQVQEIQPQAYMDDYIGVIDEPITPTEIIATLVADSYDPVTGVVVLNTADPNLANVRVNQLLVDGNGNEYPILGGITNDPGDKRVSIKTKICDFDLSNVKIISNLNFERKLQKSINESETIVLPIVTEEPLLTKYLFIIIKYILNSRKSSLIARGVAITSFDATDFNRWGVKLPDNCYARFISARFQRIEQTWVGEKVSLIEAVNPTPGIELDPDPNLDSNPEGYAVRVERDLYKRDDEDNLTVRTVEDSSNTEEC